MNKKSLIHVLAIVLLFLLGAALVTFVLQPSALGPTGNQNVQEFWRLFQTNAYYELLVSFVCTLLWFALGEWVIRGWSPTSTWYVTWLVLLILIVASAIYLAYLGPRGDTAGPVNYTVLSYYLGFGVLWFYLSTVLFSPTNAKFAIWPAKLLRRW